MEPAYQAIIVCLWTLLNRLTPIGLRRALVVLRCVLLNPRCVWSFHLHNGDTMSMPRLTIIRDEHAPLFPGSLRCAWRCKPVHRFLLPRQVVRMRALAYYGVQQVLASGTIRFRSPEISSYYPKPSGSFTHRLHQTWRLYPVSLVGAGKRRWYTACVSAH